MSTAPTKPLTKKSSTATGSIQVTGKGVVDFYIHKTQPEKMSVANLVRVVEAGLPVTELTDLQANLDVPAERLAPMLGISKATFHRHKGSGKKLEPGVSDRIVRFAKLLGQAAHVLGSMNDAKRWLNSAQFGLGGAVPLDYARTEVGAREVENLLGRIEHGVYS